MTPPDAVIPDGESHTVVGRQELAAAAVGATLLLEVASKVAAATPAALAAASTEAEAAGAAAAAARAAPAAAAVEEEAGRVADAVHTTPAFTGKKLRVTDQSRVNQEIVSEGPNWI